MSFINLVSSQYSSISSRFWSKHYPATEPKVKGRGQIPSKHKAAPKEPLLRSEDMPESTENSLKTLVLYCMTKRGFSSAQYRCQPIRLNQVTYILVIDTLPEVLFQAELKAKLEQDIAQEAAQSLHQSVTAVYWRGTAKLLRLHPQPIPL